MGKRACGFVIFRRLRGQIEYLLLQTSYQDHHWTPPKGHVDPGESDMVTAIRETEEEAGFVKDDLKIFEDAKKQQVYKVKGKPKTVIYWLAELVKMEKTPKLSHEHQDFKWLGIEEACKIADYAEMQQTLRYFDEYIATKIVES